MTRAPSALRALSRRPRLRDLTLGVVSALSAFGLASSGCGTDAVGVEACRDIELARCEAAQYCGRIDDVPACRRFYRDHCLHGLADGIEPPTQDEVAACVATIEKAGKCAKTNRLATLEECDSDVTTDSHGATLACEIVLLPEWSAECSFLGKRGDLPTRPGDGGDGGAMATGGTTSTGGTSPAGGGQGGAP